MEHKFNPLAAMMAGTTKMLRPLDIQYFAGDGGDGGTDPAGDTDPIDPPATPPVDPPAGGTDPIDPPTKTYTDEDLTAAQQEAQKKLMKQLGITDVKAAKEQLQQFAEWQKSQKTEQELIAEQNKELQQNYENVLQEKETIEAKFAAVTNGIKSEFVDDVIVLAKTMVSEDVTIEDAIKKVAEKYPHFKGDTQPADPTPDGSGKPKPVISTGKHGGGAQPTELEQWVQAFGGGNKQQ